MTTPRDDIAGKETHTVHDPFLKQDVEVSSKLTDRLRGKYAKGPTMPNGEPEFGWSQFETPPIQHEAADAIDALQARVMELEGQVYVPGSWHCPKCKFTLLQSNLNAHDGTVTARDTPGDKCPNCSGPLWRCTWKNDACEMQERAVEQMERAKAAESRATRLQQERDEAYERLKTLAEARALSGVRKLVAGWNGEGREDGPYTRHPDELGATLPKTNCGAIYQLDDAISASRDLVRRLAGPEKEGK